MIKLSNNEISFILDTLELPTEIQKFLVELSNKKHRIISDDMAVILRELSIERFDVYGLDLDYEPTCEGKILNRLIDKLLVV